MTRRLSAVVAAVLLGTTLAPAQPVGTYSKAVPPEKAVLDRLNLKAEWTQFLPVEGTRDALTQVQTIDDQVFVQTRTGAFVAIDALTGRIQWAARLGNGGYSNSYPVAANSTYVFVAHVTKLYAFYRYTGTTEFAADLGAPPTVGLAADERSVYCVLGMRSGGAGAHRVAVYDLPRPIVVTEPGKAAVDPLAQGAKVSATSAVDDLLKRYGAGAIGARDTEVFEPANRPNVMSVPISGLTGAKSPSLSVLPSVVPPYNLTTRAPAPSLSTLTSIKPPYHLRSEASKYVQQTPSLSTIPPSVAAALALTDLRPKTIEAPLRWEYGLNARVLYPVILTPTRAWLATEGDFLLALNKLSEPGKVVTEVKQQLTNNIPAAPSASGLTHFIPLGNGTVVAVDAVGGNLAGGITIKWRAVTGGINNHTPFVTKNFIYSSGDNCGVVCIHRFDGPFLDGKGGEAPKTDDLTRVEARPRAYLAGDVVWRSDDNADRIIAANEEFVYIRDRQGNFLVYDAKRATDPVHKRSTPLGTANLSEFNVHVVSTAYDRVFLAADNGLIVCLRDAKPKYNRPMRIWPPPEVNPAARVGVEGVGGDPMMKKDTEPKKEP